MFTTLGMISRTSGASVGTFPLPNSGNCAKEGAVRKREQVIVRIQAMPRGTAFILTPNLMIPPDMLERLRTGAFKEVAGTRFPKIPGRIS
jgi:hypothetical protein